MTADEIKSNPDKFYGSYAWKKVKRMVHSLDRNECTICKANGKYSRGVIAHHTNHLKDRPEWALDIYYIDGNRERKRNIVLVCSECHEIVCHPERLRWKEAKKPLTKERW